MRAKRSKKTQELLAAGAEFEDIVRQEVGRLPAAKGLAERRREREDPRTDTVVCARVRARDKEEMEEGNFSVMAGRNPFVVTFEPSFSFKGHARVHPLRFPADMVFEEKYEEEDRSATELQQRCGGNLTEMTMSGGTGLFVAVGETNSGKAVTYKSFLLKTVEAMLVKCRNKRKNCFVSFVEIRGSTVTDLMSTNSNMEIREDSSGRLRGAEAIENKITSSDQFSKLFQKVTRVERRTGRDRALAHLLCRLRVQEDQGHLPPLSRTSSMASIATVNGGRGGVEEGRLEKEEEGLLYFLEVAGLEQVEMVESRKEAQQLSRSISALRECLKGRAMSVTNPDQVHPIPYHQSPLTMLLREALSVERMRQTKILLVGSLSPCVEDLHSSIETLGFLSSVKMANREQKNVEHDEENPVNWGKEEVDSWLQLQWPQLGPRNPVSQLSGWQLLRLTVTQFLALCGSQVGLEEALQVYAAFWQLYLEARTTTAVRDEQKKPKFQAGEPARRKSYAEILNGDDEEDEKVIVALGTSKKCFEQRLNEGFKDNIPRYQRKNEEMMKMEWANKVAASDRAEAKLYPILSIATSTPAPDVSPGASRTRRNSIYT